MDFVSQRRQEAHEFGRAHREALLAEWMLLTGETTRPLLWQIIDELIEDVLHARLRDEVLPLDRFAQTERVNGRLEVSVNSRLREMPRVKNIEGIRFVAKCHETIHLVRDFPEVSSEVGSQIHLPGLNLEVPQIVVCRGFRDARSSEEKARESFAENAGTATAICSEDLLRCHDYLEFVDLISKGGDPGKYGWRLIYQVADFIGVNGPLLAKFWQQQGFIKVGSDGHLLAQPILDGNTHG